MTRLVRKWTHFCTPFFGENQRYDDLNIKAACYVIACGNKEGVDDQQKNSRATPLTFAEK